MPSGWFHTVVNYDGPSTNVTVYIDGQERGTTQGNYFETSTPSDGTAAVGRMYTDGDTKYTNFTMDELTFWNRKTGSARN